LLADLHGSEQFSDASEKIQSNSNGHFSIQAHKDLRHNNIHHALRFSFFPECIHSIGTEFADGFQSLFGYYQ
jgi:hypothetical protein